MKPVLVHKKKEIAVHPRETSTFFQGMNEFFKKIEKRAYELFEARGHEDGRDLDDWFQAENELFQAVPLTIKEEEKRMVIHADVPGFNADDLEIALEPAMLTIQGSHKEETEKKEKQGVYCETAEKAIFRRVALPTEVVPDKAHAILKGGVLEIIAPKAIEPGKVEAAAA